MSLDPASLIVAATGLLAAWGGLRTSANGRADANRQSEVAHEVERHEQAWEESQTMIAHLRTDADRERAGRERAERRYDQLRSLVDDHEPWDAARRLAQPDGPPPPPLRLPTQRQYPETP